MEGGDICMSSIDERVVDMKFNNEKFESGVRTTLDSLGKLKTGLNLDAAKKSLDGVQASADRFNLQRIADGVETISSKFTALGIAGVTALANIANRAVNAGVALVKSLTIDPIKSGLDEYNTQLTSVQTILANTQASGATLKDVNATLNELNTYADKTIYNFSEMTRNIGTFTAAGVDLKTSQESIKGIANLAALSGSNAQQASTAMYQLSQAISSGKVGLQDWNSVVNAGMGGTVFQRALAQTAVAMDKLPASALKLSGAMKNVKINGESFRESISAKGGKGSWLTSDVLTNTLKILSNDLSAAQIKAMGFTQAQAVAMKGQAELAMQAATVVKTLPDLIGTVKESVGSGWTTTWQLIFGDFSQAKSLWTGVYKTLNGLVSASANARNKLLKDWQDAGGRTAAINAIGEAFKGVMVIVNAFKSAFHDIFPPLTGAQLADITRWILTLAESFKSFVKMYKSEIENTFKGFFAILDIGKQIVFGLIRTIAGLFGGFGDGAGSVLLVTSAIGQWLVKLDEAIKNGTGLTTFFTVLGKILSVPVHFIGILIGYLGSLGAGLGNAAADGAGFTGFLENLLRGVQPLQVGVAVVTAVWQRFGRVIQKIWNFFGPMATAMGNLLSGLGDAITSAFQDMNYSDVLDTINTGLFAALILMVRKFFSKPVKVPGGGFLDSIKGIFDGITGTFEAMQQNLKANVLLKIAGALAIMTAAVVALSLIDSGRLTAALAAMTTMFVELGASMAVFGKVAVPGLAKMPVLTTSLILLAIAIDILASAVVKLAKVDWQGLAKGLIGVGVLLGEMAGAVKLMGNPASLVGAGLGMIAIAGAINILATAVKTLGSMDMGALTQGLIGVAGGLAIMVGAMSLLDLMGPGIIIGAGALVIASAAMVILAQAMQAFGGMTWAEIGQGLTVMAGALTLLAAGLYAMTFGIAGAPAIIAAAAAMTLLAPAMQQLGGMSWAEIGQGLTVLAGALAILAVGLTAMILAGPGSAALVVAAGALLILAPAVQAFGSMSWAAIGQGLVVLAGAMAILAVGLTAMIVAMPGALALTVAAAALALFVPLLAILGTMSWATIGTGLGALAASLAVLGIAGALMTPVIPTLLGLAGAIALLGVGVALAGVGVLAFSAGMTALGVAGAAGAAGLTAAFSAIINLIPAFIKSIGTGVVAAANVIAKGAPAIVNAIIAVLKSLIGAIGVLVPQIVNLVVKLITQLVSILAKYVPTFVTKGMALITGILDGIAKKAPALVTAGVNVVVAVLNGIAKNVGRMATAAANVVIAFINAIGSNQIRIINAGMDMIVKFVNGLANGIRTHTAQMRSAGLNLATAIIDGMTGGIFGGVGKVVDAAKQMAGQALQAAKDFLGIHSPSKEFYKVGDFINQGLALGLIGTHDQVTSAIQTLQDDLKGLLDSSAQDIDTYTQKVADLKSKISKDVDAINKQKQAVAQAEADRKSGKAVDQDTVKLQQLSAARAKDEAAIKKYAAAAKASYKKDGAAKRAQARLDLQSAKANLAANAQQIKETKAKLAKDKADIKNGTSVKAAQKKLTDLRAARDKDTASLKDANSSLSTAQDENKKAAAAMDELNNKLAEQQTQLDDLATKNDALTQSISDQQKVLDDATKTRDDYNKSITDQYDALQSISSDTVLADYEAGLQKQIDDTKAFAAQLAVLRAQGLNDTLYKKFLSEGTADIPFLEQLLDSGKAGIDTLNGLTDQLQSTSSSLGDVASKSLYQAAVDSAAGLLKGLQDQQAAIEAQMEVIATSMVNAIKEKLGIHSPSREFSKIGGYSADGLIQGFKQATASIGSAAEGIGNTALSSLKDSMSNMSKLVMTDMELNPVIRPVLDLSAIQQGAGALGNMLTNPALAVESNYASATAAANGYGSNQEAILAAKTDVAGAKTIFNQYNNSPKALSPAEIYRQTKNQLSVAKRG
jgi:tape measure domain-containing protein